MSRVIRIPMKSAPKTGDLIQITVRGYVKGMTIDPLAPVDEQVLVELEVLEPATESGRRSYLQASGMEYSPRRFVAQQGVGDIGSHG